MTDVTHTQWATRPNDERFWSVQELNTKLLEDKPHLRQSQLLDPDTLRVEAEGPQLAVYGTNGSPAYPTYHAAGQLASLAGLRIEPFRRIEAPAELVAPVLNHGLKHRQATSDRPEVRLYLKADPDAGHYELRAITGPQYQRFHNHELTGWLTRLTDAGWLPPPAYPRGVEGERTRQLTDDDVTALGGASFLTAGSTVAPAGVYLGRSSTPELFVFLVKPGVTIDPGKGRTLHRYALLWNSELGDASLGMELGWLDGVCGNHYRWGARTVMEVRARHVGQGVFRALGTIHKRVEAEPDRQLEEQRVRAAQQFQIAGTKVDVLKKLFAWGVTKRDAAASWELAEQQETAYGSPVTAWAQASALTELAGGLPVHQRRSLEANAATVLDKAVGVTF